jgi:hypothetical protein
VPCVVALDSREVFVLLCIDEDAMGTTQPQPCATVTEQPAPDPVAAEVGAVTELAAQRLNKEGLHRK